jgi:ribonuclease BN (tRNA processing enzyme)
MQLIVLGSGSSVPHPKRASSGYWLEAEGGSVLLDCSAAAVHRMAQEGCDWVELGAIWISHFHLDHCGGLPAFLFGTKHAPETQGRTKPMRIFGPTGLRKLIETFDSAYDYGFFRQPFPLEIVEIAAGQKLKMAGMEASFFSTPHTEDSHAIRLEAPSGRSIVFSSDTGYSTNLAVFARDADVLLIECSFVRETPVKIHLDANHIVQMAKFANAKRIVLTHLYPEWDGREAEAMEMLEGLNVEIAFDGMRIDL